jgi:hypothetical protein
MMAGFGAALQDINCIGSISVVGCMLAAALHVRKSQHTAAAVC